MSTAGFVPPVLAGRPAHRQRSTFADLDIVASPALTQRDRMVEIRTDLLDRITEAEHQGWAGEVEGLKVSLAGVEQILGQLNEITRQRTETVHLGIPSFDQVAGRTTEDPQ